MKMWINPFASFLTKFNSILDKYAPLKKISKKKIYIYQKLAMDNSWPTKINFIKNHELTRHIKFKNVTLKNKAQIKYKQYINLLSTLI